MDALHAHVKSIAKYGAIKTEDLATFAAHLTKLGVRYIKIEKLEEGEYSFKIPKPTDN